MGDFSYEYLFDVVRRERSREELQKLDESFYTSAESYMQSQADDVLKFDPLSEASEKLRTQLQNTRKLLKELYDRRERKIMLLAINKARTGSSIIDTTALLPRESKLFEEMVGLLLTARKELPLTNGDNHEETPKKAPEKPEEEKPLEPEPTETLEDVQSKIEVKILAKVPKFMGGASETYGPYEEGSEIKLPDKIANILVKKGRAEHV